MNMMEFIGGPLGHNSHETFIKIGSKLRKLCLPQGNPDRQTDTHESEFLQEVLNRKMHNFDTFPEFYVRQLVSDSTKCILILHFSCL